VREIKFRGYRKDIGWKYGYLTTMERQDGRTIPAIRPFDEKYITYGVDPESVGETTGLHDKKGVEIYEGDILRWPDGTVAQVIWMGYPAAFSPMDLHQASEIVGNIHENPELLKEVA
jgi:uncharacterized phage protein (TIGR01671 family)